MPRAAGQKTRRSIEVGKRSRPRRSRLDNSIQPDGAVHLVAAEYTQMELKQWWKDSAIKWLADPRADSELLYVACLGLSLAEPKLAQQCLEECRERRKGKK